MSMAGDYGPKARPDNSAASENETLHGVAPAIPQSERVAEREEIRQRLFAHRIAFRVEPQNAAVQVVADIEPDRPDWRKIANACAGSIAEIIELDLPAIDIADVPEHRATHRCEDREAIFGIHQQQSIAADRRDDILVVSDERQRRLAVLRIARILARGAEQIERERAMRCVAAGREALRERHVDGTELLNHSRAAAEHEGRPRCEAQIPRALRKLLEEIRVGLECAERVLDRCAREEAVMRVDRVVALVPEERR